MSEIGFYHLTKTPLERALPKLLEKALSGNFRVLIQDHDETRLEEMNRWLWTYDPASFLPHGSKADGNAERQPIYLTTEQDNKNNAQVLAVVDGSEPPNIGEYSRVLDLFDGTNDESTAAARSRWKKYKEAGHTLTYWKQNDRGGWEKAA